MASAVSSRTLHTVQNTQLLLLGASGTVGISSSGLFVSD